MCTGISSEGARQAIEKARTQLGYSPAFETRSRGAARHPLADDHDQLDVANPPIV